MVNEFAKYELAASATRWFRTRMNEVFVCTKIALAVSRLNVIFLKHTQRFSNRYHELGAPTEKHNIKTTNIVVFAAKAPLNVCKVHYLTVFGWSRQRNVLRRVFPQHLYRRKTTGSAFETQYEIHTNVMGGGISNKYFWAKKPQVFAVHLSWVIPGAFWWILKNVYPVLPHFEYFVKQSERCIFRVRFKLLISHRSTIMCWYYYTIIKKKRSREQNRFVKLNWVWYMK